MRTVFHIASKGNWEAQIGNVEFTDGSLKKEGYIHFSRPHQLLGTIQNYFKDHKDPLILLTINQERLSCEIKYEGNGENKFPHLYGPLNRDAVLQVTEFRSHELTQVFPIGLRMHDQILIRRGLMGDEGEIANVHVHAWQQCYQGLIPKDYLDKLALSFRGRQNMWRKIVKKVCLVSEAQDSSFNRIFVAESANDGIVAFCMAEKARDPERLGWGEISSIYCLQQYKGLGIGKALFEEARHYLSGISQQGFYLWVLKDNPTIQFYQKMGGEISGMNKNIFLGQELSEIEMIWKA